MNEAPESPGANKESVFVEGKTNGVQRSVILLAQAAERNIKDGKRPMQWVSTSAKSILRLLLDIASE